MAGTNAISFTSIIPLLISITVLQENIKLNQFYFKTGFLNRDIENYMNMKKSGGHSDWTYRV